jgi:hypothetical protein
MPLMKMDDLIDYLVVASPKHSNNNVNTKPSPTSLAAAAATTSMGCSAEKKVGELADQRIPFYRLNNNNINNYNNNSIAPDQPTTNLTNNNDKKPASKIPFHTDELDEHLVKCVSEVDEDEDQEEEEEEEDDEENKMIANMRPEELIEKYYSTEQFDYASFIEDVFTANLAIDENDNSNNNNNNNLRSNAYLDEDIQVEDLENIDDVPTFRNTNNQHSEGTDGPSHRIFAAIPPPNNNNNKSSTTTSKTSTVAAVTTEEKSKTTTISYNIESGNSITTSTL